MKIVDNFLNREDFFFVKESILGSRMYWLYEDHKVSKTDNDLQATQFYHMFCEFYNPSNLINSNKIENRKFHNYHCGKEVLLDTLLLSKCKNVLGRDSNVITSAQIIGNLDSLFLI